MTRSPKIHISIQSLRNRFWKRAHAIYPPGSITLLLRYTNTEIKDACVPYVRNDLRSSIEHRVLCRKRRHVLMEFV